jgi:hypothetical protein
MTNTEGMTPDQQSMAEAMESLTVAEVAAIERHFGGEFGGEGITPTSLTVGVVWALERRRLLGQPERPEWKDLDSWTLKELNGYFAPEAQEIDPTEPESAEGKGV